MTHNNPYEGVDRPQTQTCVPNTSCCSVGSIVGAWLTAYAYYYNQLRSHQALDNQPPIEAASLS